METGILSTARRGDFPRYHNHCDRCGCEVHYSEGNRGEVETAAGSFAYRVCGPCGIKLERMAKPARERAKARAMAKHAARYSPDFGRFVASWVGVQLPQDCRKDQAG